MASYKANQTGLCPHCLHRVRFEIAKMNIMGQGWMHYSSAFLLNNFPDSSPGSKDLGEKLHLLVVSCPECKHLIVTLETTDKVDISSNFTAVQDFVVWPRQSTRPVPQEVRDEHPNIATDYDEAVAVLPFSPKASAALSRRCLQTVLREKGGATQRDLSKQIDAVIPYLPAYIVENVDAIRNIGNFAAHPMKSTASGEIIDVEPGEAEWNLDVLDMLFDHYYVKPAQNKAKRDALNVKLQAAGKPSMR